MSRTSYPRPSTTSDLTALAKRRDELRDQRDDLVQRRRAAQREAAELPAILNGIRSAQRDRDAHTSTRMVRHREVFERVMADLEAMQVAIARMARRLAGSDLPQSDPRRRRSDAARDQALRALVSFAEAFRAEAAREQGQQPVGEGHQ